METALAEEHPLAANEIAERAAQEERLGRWEAAGSLYARLFQVAAETGSMEILVDSLRGGARVRRQQGQYEEAEELAELSWAISEQHNLPQAVARAINTVAVIRYSREDWHGARTLYETALERARDLGDDELIGLICQNLGVVSNVLGNLREARTLYLESIGSSVRSGNAWNAISAYNNLGLVCSDLGEWMEAELYFSRGIEIAERVGNSPLLARLHSNRAEPLIAISDLFQARQTLDTAEMVAVRVRDQGALADVARFRGVIARLEGDLPIAREQLTLSAEIAVQGGFDLERGEALRELAQLEWVEGNRDRAVNLADDAREVFASLGTRREMERVAEMVARWGLPEAGQNLHE